MQKNNKIVEYDIMRTIGVILVVLGHSLYLNMGNGQGGVDYTSVYSLGNLLGTNGYFNVSKFIVNPIYFFHMPFMFFVSGAVFRVGNKNKPYDFTRLIKNKAKRLLGPYIIYGILWMIPIKVISHFYEYKMAPYAVIALLSGAGSGHLWYLTTLFWIFIIAYFIYSITKQKKKYIFLTSVILFLLSNAIGTVGLPGAVSPFYYMFFFSMGYMFEESREQYIKLPTYTKVLCIAALAIYSYIMYKRMGAVDTSAHPLMSILKATGMLSCCYLIFCLVNIFKNFGKCKVFENTHEILNSSSMDVYLLHDPLNYLILLIVSIAFRKMAIGDEVQFWIVWFMRTFVVFFVCLFVSKCINSLKKRMNFKMARIIKIVIVVIVLASYGFVCYNQVKGIIIDPQIYTNL